MGGAGEVRSPSAEKSHSSVLRSPSGHKQYPTALSVNEDTPTTRVFVQSFIEARRIVAASNETAYYQAN